MEAVPVLLFKRSLCHNKKAGDAPFNLSQKNCNCGVNSFGLSTNMLEAGGILHFQNLKGRWSIGTDSQIGIDFFQDLRLLDYSQRINTHKRDTFFLPNEGDSGFNAIKMSWQSGRKAMGKSSEKFFEIGEPFDAVVMDSESALLATASLKNLCNTMVYSSDVSHIFGTILDGNWVVKNGQHQKKEEINKAFIETIKALKLR